MSFNIGFGKPTPASDTWMEDTQSDDSESVNRKQPTATIAKSRPSHVANCKASNFTEEDGTSSESSVELDDDDDADDEDWVAFDSEKKRGGRGNMTARPSGTHKLQTLHRDRSRTKLHSSPRSSNQTTATSIRPGRPGSHPQKSVHRTECTRVQAATVTSKRNPGRSSTQGVSPRCSFPNESSKPRQCFGPGCTRSAARPDTKYCSDECGIKLAIRRLEVLLPKRLDGDSKQSGKSVADQLYKTRLNEIQGEKRSVHDRLLQLEVEHQQLTSLIARARESTRNPVEDATLDEATREAEQVEQMEPVICVTCASEVSMRHALRHMEKCFQKMEGSTVFCASQKEQIMGTPLFCDTYDNQAKAFCKRLRVVCEHFKEPKLPPDTICGFPLVRQVFVETGEFCSVPRNKCSRHLGWERLRRAHIDIERYRCLVRMDELLHEEQRLHQSISQRGGVLGLLLHQTIEHNPSIPVPLPPELTGSTDNS